MNTELNGLNWQLSNMKDAKSTVIKMENALTDIYWKFDVFGIYEQLYAERWALLIAIPADSYQIIKTKTGFSFSSL